MLWRGGGGGEELGDIRIDQITISKNILEWFHEYESVPGVSVLPRHVEDFLVTLLPYGSVLGSR